jgi:hypothetical protein
MSSAFTRVHAATSLEIRSRGFEIGRRQHDVIERVHHGQPYG